MTDHGTKDTALLVTLCGIELAQAARLGGLILNVDEHMIDDADLTSEMVRHLAKRGLQMALQEQYAREYPQHYPDDVETSFWQMNTDSMPVTGGFGYCWRGKVSW